MVVKVEWYFGELYFCVGFIVINLSCLVKWVVIFYNYWGIVE